MSKSGKEEQAVEKNRGKVSPPGVRPGLEL